MGGTIKSPLVSYRKTVGQHYRIFERIKYKGGAFDMFVLALIGSFVNYIISLLLYFLRRQKYKTYLEVLKGDGMQHGSIWDYRPENLSTGIIFTFGYVILHVVFESIIF